MENNSRNALLMFTKAPIISKVKTRLQPELSPKESLQIYKAMVEDNVEKFYNLHFCDLKIFYYPSDSERKMKNWLGSEIEFFPQRGRDLGERMHNAILKILNQNYKKVLLIGSDIPTVDKSTLVRGFANLETFDVVLGPCEDGGYYLIGMKEAHAELFQEIPWSTSEVLHLTKQKAEKVSLDLIQLELKSDIDTFEDLKSLWDQLTFINSSKEELGEFRTYVVLQELSKKKKLSSLKMEKIS